MARRDDEFSTCDGDAVFPVCAEHYPCSLCYGSGSVSDGYEDHRCGACDGTGCGYASVCGCCEEE